MEGRVEPSREVRQTAATPDMRPVSRNRIILTRATRMPLKVRGGRVVADGIDLPAEIGEVQEHAVDQRQGREEHQLEGDDPADVAAARRPGEAVGVAVEGLIAQNDVADAAKQAHRADGDDDGRQAEARDEYAVERAAEQAHRQPDGRPAPGVPTPYCSAQPIAVEASAMMPATERSISPEMISSAMAKATIAFSVKLKVASRQVPGIRK